VQSIQESRPYKRWMVATGVKRVFRRRLFALVLGWATAVASGRRVEAAERTYPYLLGQVAQDPNSTGTLFATGQGLTSGALFPGSVFRSTDFGRSWNATATPPIPDGIISTLQTTGSPTVLFCGGVGESLFRSDDFGGSWSPTGPTGFQRLWSAPRSSAVVYAIFESGLFRSSDLGRTWLSAGVGLPTFAPPGAVAVDPQDSRIAYAIVSQAPAAFHSDEGLYRTTDGGSTWSPLVLHFPNSTLVVDPARTSTIFAQTQLCRPGRCDVSTSRSDDSGATWSPATAVVIGGDAHGTLYGLPSGSQLIARSFDHGEHWEPLLPQLQLFTSSGSDLIVRETVEREIFGSTDSGTTWFPMTSPEVTGCYPSGDALCLGGGRFRAWITFHAPSTGQAIGHPVPLTADAGAFWFFTDNNIELVLKVVDGTAVNCRFWVFGGALTDVEYDLQIFDTATGVTWRRHNTTGELESFADTSAF